MKITFRAAPPMDEVVQFCLETLREKSPVGTAPEDEHPGLYRDSHLIFLNGGVVKDVLGWKRGDTIHVSNPVPYARKIETGRMKMSLPAHVYEQTEQIARARFGNQVSVRLVFMPVRFSGIAAWASFSKLSRAGNAKARRDWLVRQPALLITSR